MAKCSFCVVDDKAERPHIAGWEKVAVKVTTVAKDVATLVTNVLAAMHIG